MNVSGKGTTGRTRRRWLAWGVLAALAAVMLFAAGGLARPATAAGPWYVDPTGNDANGCKSKADACLTIQGAIDKAADGDTILVNAGTYDVDTVINVSVANLTINGIKGTTIVDGAGKDGSIVDGQDVLFNVSASGVTIQDLTIDLGDDTSDFDVGIFTPNDASVDSLTVRNNTMRFAAFGNTIGEQLIHLGGGTGNTVEHNDLETASANSTIYVGDNTNAALTIQGNTIAPDSDADGGGTAINSFGPVTAGSNSTISDNTFTKTGIAVWLGADQLGSGTATDGVTVTGNTFTDTTNAGWSAVVIAAEVDGVATRNITVTFNSFSGSAGDAVLVNDFGNTGDVDASTVNINCNDFDGTNGGGVNVVGVTGTADAEDNWWGAADGPSDFGPGSGDSVSDNVDFEPFLTNPFGASGSPCYPDIKKVPTLANLWLCNSGAESCDVSKDQGIEEINLDVELNDSIFSPDPKCVETGQDPDTCKPQQLGAFEFEVRYDAKFLIVDWEFGELARLMVCMKNRMEGTLQIACVTKGKPEDAPSGPGVLATLKIRATPDVYSMLIANQGNGIATQLINQDCNLADLQGHPIKLQGQIEPGIGPGVCEDAAITIRYLEGDVHADCVVDVLDQQQISFRMFSRLGNLLYNSRYDLEPSAPSKGDGDIDAKDVQFVFGRHVSTCKAPWPPQDPVDPKAKLPEPPPNAD